MIDPKKELNNDELKNVNGGCSDPDAYLPKNHGKHIGQYDAKNYVNQKVYVVWDSDHEAYYWGILKKSEGISIGASTFIQHWIQIEGCNNYHKCKSSMVGSEREFDGCAFTLFLYN